MYDTVELRDRVVATNGTSPGSVIGRARVFGFSYDSGIRDSFTARYRLAVADLNMYVNLGVSSSVSWTAGTKIFGQTSGAAGFVRTSGSSSTVTLEQVTGTFVSGEALRYENGTSNIQTVSSVTAYQFTDAKSFAISGQLTANIVLDVQIFRYRC